MDLKTSRELGHRSFIAQRCDCNLGLESRIVFASAS
jgi:hypothetical protein